MKNRGIMILAVGIAGSAGLAGAEVSLQEVAQGVRASESRLLNVRVDGTYRGETWNKDDARWDFSSEAQVTARYVGVPGSKVRIDFHRQVLQWPDGPAPFSEIKYTVAYNGRVGQEFFITSVLKGQVHTDLRGRIHPKRPPVVVGWGGRAGGWEFSLYGLLDSYALRLSAVFDAVKPNRGFRLSGKEAQFHGVHCVQLSCKEPDDSARIVYLDPKRGYAIIGFEKLRANGTVSERFVVEKLLEPAPGIFYPGKVKAYRFDSSGNPRGRGAYEASAVVVNDPDFSEDVFTIQWPLGARIYDEQAGMSFRIGGELKGVVERIDEQLSRIEGGPPEAGTTSSRALGVAPEVAKIPGNDLPSSHDLGGEPATVRRMHYWWVLGGIAVLGAFVVVIIMRKRRATAALMLVAAVLAGSNGDVLAQVRSMAVQEIGQQKLVNCGLYTCLFVCKHFGLVNDLAVLAPELGVGERWERPCSLHDMKKTIQKRGLTVKAYKSITVKDVLGNLDADRLLVFHTVPRGSSYGHYYVAKKAEGHTILVVDTGVREFWLSENDFARRFGGKLSGYGLFVESQRSRPGAFDLSDPLLRVELGETATAAQGELVVAIPVINRKDSDLALKRWKGDCGCFKGARFRGSEPRRLRSRATGTLQLTFERARLRSVMRVLLVIVDGSGPRDVLVEVRAELSPGPGVEKQVAWLPEKIDFGLIRDLKSLRRPQLVTILAPPGVTVSGVKASSRDVRVVRVQEKTRLSPDGEWHGTRVGHRYEITVLNSPARQLREYVEFTTTGKDLPKITIAITGEMLLR